MKHILLYSFAAITLAIGMLACSGTTTGENGSAAKSNAESPAIKIQVEGAPTGQAYLVGMFTDQRFRLDSAQVGPTGEMQFKRQEPYPGGMMILVLPDQTYFQFMVDQDQTFTLTTQKSDMIGGMAVEGSVDNKILYENLKYERDFQRRFQPVRQQIKDMPTTDPNYATLKQTQDQLLAERKAHIESLYDQYPNSFFTKFKKAGQNPELRDIRKPDGTPDEAAQVYHYRKDFWKDVDFSDERLIRTPVIANKLNRYMTELTVQNQDSIINSAKALVEQVMDYPEYYQYFVNWIAIKYEPTKTTLMDPEAVYVHMVQNYFTYDRAFWSDSAEVYSLQLRATEMAGSLLGLKGPEVEAKDPNGQIQSLYAKEAPYVLVFMYNPTCEHCIEETPKLVAFHKEWKNKGFDVYAIAVDTEEADWKNFIQTYGTGGWTNVFDPTNNAIYGKYFVDITPELYLLNPERKIIAKNIKVDQIAEVIARDQSR